MEELLVADDPLPLLFEDLAVGIRDHSQWRLGASRFVLYDPTVAAEETAVLDDTGKRYHGLRVLGAVQDWWIVFLPAWGRAWVHTGDASVVTASPTEQELVVTGVKAIDCMEMYGVRDQAATAALLRLVGTNVTTLKLAGLETNMGLWCPMIFDACTGLQALHLGGMSTERLSEVFESITHSHATKLECLTVDFEYFCDENLADVITVFDALADRRHVLSKQLRRVGFCARSSANFGIAIGSPEVFARAVHMLDNNETLECLQINLPVPVQTAAQSASLQAAIHRHQRRQLPLEINQIGVREKAAFLSALRGEHSTPAMRNLDRGVVSTILDFAPKPRFRCVNIEPPHIA